MSVLVLSAIHLRHEWVHDTQDHEFIVVWDNLRERKTFELGFEEWVGFPLVKGWLEKLFYAKGLV